MRTIVIGAGAVGNATAFYLHKRGHEVVVIERQPGAALETSLGNGGVVHASEVEPWSQPGMPWKILSLLGQESEVDSRWLDGYTFSLSGPIYAGTNEVQRNIVA